MAAKIVCLRVRELPNRSSFGIRTESSAASRLVFVTTQSLFRRTVGRATRLRSSRRVIDDDQFCTHPDALLPSEIGRTNTSCGIEFIRGNACQLRFRLTRSATVAAL